MNNTIESIKKYTRVANYLSAVQIYLQDNFLLERELKLEDIKPRLLGHWGSCPGINFVYANLNALVKKYSNDVLFILGPGHGFPALQSNLFIEGTLEKYYSEATRDEKGVGYISKNFSWPYGFPSHSNPETPGVILEGGELGYALSTAYGSVLDNPDLITCALIGDGEAETGPTATAWHLNKFVDPKTNGAVLPILHLNGYKISGPTVFGRMSNEELTNLFSGYGYEPFIVDGWNDVENVYEKMFETLNGCYKKIKEIQNQARNEKEIIPPRFPMIILKTLKGWTGIKELDGQKIEGNCLSHQVIGPDAKENPETLKAIENWLKSYNFGELFDKKNGFCEEIKEIIPDKKLRMGDSKYCMGDRTEYKSLKLPEVDKFSEDSSIPGTIGSSSMRRAGLYLNEVFKLNEKNKNFRLFSPDETYSNKLDEVFKTTSRAFVWPVESWDKDLKQDGRVMEMLSEHSLQGLMQGYVLTKRHGIFASYEAFIQIVSSMADQYAKFLKIARKTKWRGDISSFNYILTSSGWRQEHNGFSHQNPGFIDDMLQRQEDFVNVYFPPDGNSTLAVLEKMLSSKNEINILVAGKKVEPRWLTPNLAKKELENGIMIWDFASDENPNIVITSVGDYLTTEALASVDVIKKELPQIKIRFVNIMAMSPTGLGPTGKIVSKKEFDEYFTTDKPVIINFHGYPQSMKQILFDYGVDSERFIIRGYVENGSTTTPFDMHVRNKTDRFNLAMDVFRKLSQKGNIEKNKADELVKKYENKLLEHTEYIKKHGVDMEEIENWKWGQS
ncbi:MAG: phosphoketolase [Parcubacteria group bacterium Athens0714_16]|nr:MAG: phosphoketolase [Parcubacteria group bacterium Athens0714_16]